MGRSLNTGAISARAVAPCAATALFTATTLFSATTLRAQDPETSTGQQPRIFQRAESGEAEKRRIRRIHITTRNLYTEEEAEENTFYGFFNWLHFTTHEEVVRRELWFGEGDTVTEFEIQELERNLRRFGIFGAADVEFVDIGVEGEADVEIDTRDRFSLVFGASPSFVGGVGGIGGSIGDINLFGTGKRLTLSAATNDLGEQSASVRYTDPQFLGTWNVLSLAGGLTDEGHFFDLRLERPFRYLADPTSYGASFSSVDAFADYFENGNTVAQVPRSTNGGRIFFGPGFGARDLRRSVGFELGGDVTDYGAARGRDAALVRVPGDTRTIDFGPYFSIDWAAKFLKVTGLDTLDYVEDLRLGATLRLRAGGVYRDEDGVGSQVQPFAQVSGRAAMLLLPETFLTLEGSGTGRWYAGETQGYRLAGAVHAFQMSLPAQTLAASYRYEAAFDQQNLQPQLTLGEDNGLRGYPAREFAGTRTALLNVENRIRTGLEVLSVHLGAVAFFDCGWVHDPGLGLSMSDPIPSAGVGLRFGSSELFGRQMLRIDAAWPLTDVNGNDYTFSISFDTQQVFSFFGSQQSLRRDF